MAFYEGERKRKRETCQVELVVLESKCMFEPYVRKLLFIVTENVSHEVSIYYWTKENEMTNDIKKILLTKRNNYTVE